MDLAHEALLRDDRRGKPYWKTLRNWVGEYRKQLEDRRLLEILAEKWQEGGRSWRSNELARGRQLREFCQVEAALSDLAADFLRTSRRRKWWRLAIGTLAVTAVACIGFGSWWVVQIGPEVAIRLLAVEIGLTSFAAPKTIPLEGGEFYMGSIEGNFYERPSHSVMVSHFAIGKYAMTFDDYDIFVLDTKARGPGDNGWGRGRRPVINVSWNDAKNYVAWLSRVTGETYRLPSEAEWEYAARAGTTTAYALPAPDGSDDIAGKNLANCNGCGSEWDKQGTAPVGSFEANAFGLHDTAGNVWEWVEDCWHESYAGEGRPDDGRAWTWIGSDCGLRVLRGGSWHYGPEFLRSAVRLGDVPDIQHPFLGFRVAKELAP